ncbi:MAG: hypothetical protein NWQ26_05165, partial [Paraglaciecola sp.]|nr:hypothetical protein [Paraglaciecola sp.]
MNKTKKHFGLNEPLRHACHSKPISRRDFIAQGFMAGLGTFCSGSVLSLFANPDRNYKMQAVRDIISTYKSVEDNSTSNDNFIYPNPAIEFIYLTDIVSTY